MNELQPMPEASRPDAPADMEVDWLDQLPVGTVVSVEALEHWKPNSAGSVQNWLLVGCTESFDCAAYRRWLRALPPIGVIVDPADARYQRFIAESTMREYR